MTLAQDTRALTSRPRGYPSKNVTGSSNDAEALFAAALENLRAVMSTGSFSPEFSARLATEVTTLRARVAALEIERQRYERTISYLRRYASVIEKERDSLRDKLAAHAARETEVEMMRRELLARHAALLDQERNLAAITSEQKRLLRDHFMRLAKGA